MRERQNSKIGEYIFLEKLGEGGFGEVWKARHNFFKDKIVAIKIPRDETYIKTLKTEGIIEHTLDNPHIVSILGFDPSHSPPYLVMEYVEGKSLREVLKENGKLPVKDALNIFDQLLDVLEYAHGQGVIHRDIKPENILINPNGMVKLTDFGLGLVSEKATGSLLYSGSMTSTGKSIAGTERYMSPEQKDGKDVDHRADIYSLGIVLFEMLTGELPAGRDLPSGLNPQVPKYLDYIYAKCNIRHAMRYKNVSEIERDLDQLTKSAATKPAAAPLIPKTVPPEPIATMLPKGKTRAKAPDTDALKRLCANYIDSVKAYTLPYIVHNKFAGQYEKPDERLMRSVEEKIDIPDSRKDDFRREIMNYINALAIDGKQFNYKSNERFRKALELKLLEDQKNSIMLSSLVSSEVEEDLNRKEVPPTPDKEYESIVNNEVRRAISADKDVVNKLCANYIDNVKAYTLRDKVLNKFTGQYEDPDEKLMRSIEERIDIHENHKDDFRREIMNYLGALAISGKQFDYTSNEMLRKALEIKLFDEFKATGCRPMQRRETREQKARRTCPPPENCGKCGENLWIFESISPQEKGATYKCSYCGKSVVIRRDRTKQQLLSDNRKGIPKAVKREVWRRDKGHCVECGSKENLEFDHIIPVSKGGANTTRNIQLLCEKCNRKKSSKDPGDY